MAKINITSIIGEVRTYWKKPAENKYISYREFAAYSVGGIGVNTINALLGYVGLSANCLLLGSAYNIEPMHLALMASIMNVINLVKAPFISMLIDNTNTRYGKFRPYLLYTGIPSAILLIAMAFIPTEINYVLKCVLLTAVYCLLLIFQGLYSLAYTSLAQVITPNSSERTSLLSISQFIYSLGPSIVNMLLPILAGLFPGGMTGFTAYRVLFPVFSLFGVALGLVTFKGTEEKIIVAKDYVAKVRFLDGIREIRSNKYFWILTFYNILSSLKYGIGSILGWYCIYVMESETALGIMNAVIGTASVPFMLLAPMFAKKLGKRFSVIFFNLARAAFAFIMLLTGNNTVLFLAALYLATLSIGGDGVMISSITADVFDYQQWKTGKRLEGFITQFSGMLVALANMGLSFILPWFYERYGLKNDYTVLFDESIRNPVFNITIIVTIISCLLTVVPILFYDMTGKKQAEIIEELKIRAEAETE